MDINQFVLVVALFLAVVFIVLEWMGLLQSDLDVGRVTAQRSTEEQTCDVPAWCDIPMPSKSLFRFPPPTDAIRWRQAQLRAASGETVLLKEVLKHFPSHLDFLDGDTQFRAYHKPVDFFLDDNTDFSVLNSKVDLEVFSNGSKRTRTYRWEKSLSESVVPPPYELMHAMNRAPVLKLGYFAFQRNSPKDPFFAGTEVGEAVMERKAFLKKWKESVADIDTPFILLHSSNENWGLLSTFLPNRTKDWGSCCDKPWDKLLPHFLDHPKTLMLLVNQHLNYSHPKLISLPRGIPMLTPHNHKMLWDMMQLLTAESKQQLVFTSSSSWGYRPKISECIAKKFAPGELEGKSYDASLSGRLRPDQYYRKLGLSKFCLALPGLGYDTFRLWEALTIGTIPIIERGVGFERTLWKLPALIVDDFFDVTPELLKVAYVEAIYRAEEFEFERLTQSFWFNFIANVSRSMNSSTILDKFPPESMENDFMRPLVPFDCHQTGTCGPGTKLIPRRVC